VLFVFYSIVLKLWKKTVCSVNCQTKSNYLLCLKLGTLLFVMVLHQQRTFPCFHVKEIICCTPLHPGVKDKTCGFPQRRGAAKEGGSELRGSGTSSHRAFARVAGWLGPNLAHSRAQACPCWLAWGRERQRSLLSYSTQKQEGVGWCRFWGFMSCPDSRWHHQPMFGPNTQCRHIPEQRFVPKLRPCL